MAWSKFTKKNLNSFIKYKYLLNNDNLLLNYIKNERKNIIQSAKNKSISINISQINNYDKIKKYTNSKFVDKQNLLNDMKKLNIIYKISWNNNLIILFTENEINLLKRVKIIVYIIEYLKEKTQNNKNVKIYLVLSSLEKQFPTDTKIMGVKNANSGYNDTSKDIIFIWRKEEFEKVLFHELIHNFSLDKRDEHVHNIINTDGPHLYFEALTDFQGIIYHLIYLSLFTRRKIKNLLEYELGFIRNQAMTLNNIWELGNWKNSPDKIIEQNTAAFSYYILKYLMFEYFLNNKFDLSDHYKTILNNVLKNGFVMTDYLKIESSRMTLFQLE
jgi:hypothetical protein